MSLMGESTTAQGDPVIDGTYLGKNNQVWSTGLTRSYV
jgi:hypothetical protein